jgi:hypothetical protein
MSTRPRNLKDANVPELHSFEHTSLWRKSLGSQAEPKAVERLRTAYLQLRKNVNQLVSQIAIALPDLTIHDVTHLDALWETSSLIVGDDFLINPLEGFILGAAILIHDSALCFEAYGGEASLRRSAEWKDAFAIATRRGPSVPEKELKKQADFASLRNLHARQAEKILLNDWRGSTHSSIYLLEDRELRETYGNLIGKIAGSHHWRIDDLAAKLPSQINAISALPSGWRINPVKLACILRCADAGHIDDRRAPDFLFALARRNGLARDHWLAQNWLSRLDTYATDSFGKTAVITSKTKFQKSASSAWCIAHDLVELLQKELSESNRLLGSRTPPVKFKIQSIAGSESPTELMKYIEVEGWTPTATEIHISNVGGLVSSLGGQNLYGLDKEVEVALRESIQNARDSVAARKKYKNQLDGKIWVSHFERGGHHYIEIADNGLGMSKEVLLGPLLDFGTSFWASELVKEEFPGLSGSDFRSIGKYGIGFYSVFMLADEVKVSSRRWDEGVKDVRTLEFVSSSVFRPTLSTGLDSDFNHEHSTCITLQLKHGFSEFKKMKLSSGMMGWPEIEVTLFDYISALCVGLDVPVFVRESSSERSTLANPQMSDQSTQAEVQSWLKQFSHVDRLPLPFREKLVGVIENAVPRMRQIKDEYHNYGFAALSISIDSNCFLASQTIGGLGPVSARHGGSYIGYIEHSTNTAKREVQNILAPQTVVQAWADNQISMLLSKGSDPVWMCKACMSVADLGADPFQHFLIMVKIKEEFRVVNIEAAIALLENIGMLITVTDYDHIHGVVDIAPTFEGALFWPLSNSNFLSTKNAGEESYSQYSLLGCLSRALVAKNQVLQIEQIGTQKAPIYGELKVMKLSSKGKSLK